MWYQKPLLGQQIKWEHPLAKGLVICWLMNEGSGHIFDCIRGIVESNWTTLPNWESSPKGPCINFNGSQHFRALNDGVDWFPSADKGSIFVIADTTDNDAAAYMFDLATPRITCLLESGTAAGTITFHHSGDSWTVANAMPSNNVFYSLVFTWNAGGNIRTAYRDGISLGSDSTALTGASPSDVLRIGARNDTDSQWNGRFVLWHSYNRVLSAEEAAWLHYEHYAIFRQPSRPKYYFVTAAAGLSIPVAMRTYRNLRL